MPLITRRSSTRGLPGLPWGRCGSIAAQFNRYNRVKLRIEGAELAAFELSANFDADDPQSLVELLETAFPVAAEHRREEIVLRGRAP